MIRIILKYYIDFEAQFCVNVVQARSKDAVGEIRNDELHPNLGIESYNLFSRLRFFPVIVPEIMDNLSALRKGGYENYIVPSHLDKSSLQQNEGMVLLFL